MRLRTALSAGFLLALVGCTSTAPEDDQIPTDAGVPAADASVSPRDASTLADTGGLVMLCPVGFGDCDRNTANGCETNVESDPENCGACDAICSNGPNSRGFCGRGFCERTCMPGYGTCDGNPLNGCETFLYNDPNNCGACGMTCSPGSVCANGVCVGGTSTSPGGPVGE